MTLPLSPSGRRGLLALLLPASALSQANAIVDEGTFMVTRNGSPVGRESFRILRSPGPAGQAYLATSQSVIGAVSRVSRLGTDSIGNPVSYEIEVRDRGQVSRRVRGGGRPGRFSTLVQTPGVGEAAREYLLTNGALVLDSGVFYQFFFVAVVARQHQHASVIMPSTGTQTRFRIEDRGAGTVEIAGRRIAARQYALASEDAATSTFWIDAAGRVLRVSLSGSGYVASRDDPPG